MLRVRTTRLQELATKAFKGVGNNKIKPITELIAIKVENDVLTLITTDYDNFLYVSEPVESEDFYAVVQANQFVKLVSRFTSEYVFMDVTNNCLEIKGNGKYKIPVEVDASTGGIVEYTDPVKKVSLTDDAKVGTITDADIKIILRAIKPSLATTMEYPQYINYYVGEKVLGTDTNTASCYDKQVSTTPLLISSAVMDILEVYTADAPLDIYKIDNRLIFKGDNFVVMGYAMQGVEGFAVDSINAYIDTEYPNKCQISKADLLQTLDRLSLFVGEFDDDTISIAFTNDGLQLTSRQSDGVETIPYISAQEQETMTSYVYLEMLKSQVKAQTRDAIDIYYGDEKSIKFVDAEMGLTSVLCLVSVD